MELGHVPGRGRTPRANARDIVKMLGWNSKYGIRFLRLSSEMFPFASHEVYGYKLAPFASKVLAGAGRVASEVGHRVNHSPWTGMGSYFPGPKPYGYLFLPLVWPLRRDLRKLLRLYGSNFKVSPHQITPVILLFDPLIAHSNYMVTGFKNLVSYR
jgi:UV-endonuclease UvdE